MQYGTPAATGVLQQLGPGLVPPSVSGGIGTEPAFLESSVLYDDMVAPYTDQWFNTSAGSGEVSPFGLPYAFFPLVWSGGLTCHSGCLAG